MFKSINVEKKFSKLNKELKNEYGSKAVQAIFNGDQYGAEHYSRRGAKGFSFSVPYRPRLRIFKSSSGKLVFNPYTGHGTSYDWYSIAQVFNGKLILNTYRYSVTTNKHIQELHSLFNQLGLKYQTIEAPRGLQDLDQAMRSNTLALYG